MPSFVSNAKNTQMEAMKSDGEHVEHRSHFGSSLSHRFSSFRGGTKVCGLKRGHSQRALGWGGGQPILSGEA